MLRARKLDLYVTCNVWVWIKRTQTTTIYIPDDDYLLDAEISLSSNRFNFSNSPMAMMHICIYYTVNGDVELNNKMLYPFIRHNNCGCLCACESFVGEPFCHSFWCTYPLLSRMLFHHYIAAASWRVNLVSFARFAFITLKAMVVLQWNEDDTMKHTNAHWTIVLCTKWLL